MLAFDKNQTLAWTPFTYKPLSTVYLSKNTAAPFAQLRNYESPAGYDAQGLSNYESPHGYDPQGLSQYPCGCGGGCPECSGLSGLGFTDIAGSLNDYGGSSGILGAVETGASFVPGVGPLAAGTISLAKGIITTFSNWLGIGAGRREADVIVPVQNQLAQRMGAIMANKATMDCNQLQQGYIELWQLGIAFMEFVLRPEFTDRRASGQALNGIMPMLDGTCGYSIPLGTTAVPTQHSNCSSFGVTWNPSFMEDLAQRMRAKGCGVPAVGEIAQAAAQGVVPQGVTSLTPLPPSRTAYTPGAVSTAFLGNIQQYAPYILAGLGIMLLTRASK